MLSLPASLYLQSNNLSTFAWAPRRAAAAARLLCEWRQGRRGRGENGNGNGKRNVRSLAFDKAGESRGDKQLNCVYAAWAALRAHANENENKNGNGNGRKSSVGCAERKRGRWGVGSNENGQRTLFGAVQRMWLMCRERGMRAETVVETADD